MAEIYNQTQEQNKCTTQVAIDDAHARIASSEAQLEELRKKLVENTEITTDLLVKTQEMVMFFNAMKSAFKVLNWIGAVAKPVSAILAGVAAGTAIWSSVKGGG